MASGPDKIILITGGTGPLGTAATRAFRQRNWTVRVMTRDPTAEKARTVAAFGAELVASDFNDAAGLVAAMKDVDGVFCIPPTVTSYMPKEAFEEQLALGKKVVDAATAAKVDHFVLSSTYSADRGINSNLATRFKIEEYARTHGLRATFLRQVSFMENFGRPQWGIHQQVFTTALLPNVKQPTIAVDDVGALAAIMFEKPHRSGTRILEIAGDELTAGDMAAALSDALGRPIPCLHISQEVLREMNENSGKGYARINAGGMNPIDLPAIRALHPGLMDFRAWLAATGAALLRPLLPLYREGAYLTDKPAWKLQSL